MKKFLLSLSVAALVTLSSSTARADVFDFSFSGPSDYGSGTITASEEGTSGIYDITAISGISDGSTISALIPYHIYPNTEGGYNDNRIYYPEVITDVNLNPSYLDLSGFSYVLADGEDINVWYGVWLGCPSDPGNREGYDLMYGPGYSNNTLDNFDLTAESAEPASLLLLGTGALGVIFLLRRRHATKPL